MPLDPDSPAGKAVTIALGDFLNEIEETVRLREAAAEPVRIHALASSAPVRAKRKAA